MNASPSKIILGTFSICAGLGICCFFVLAPVADRTRATVITITQDGSVFLANEKLGLSQLSASLKKQTADTITIQTEVNSDYTRAAEVVNVCKAAGASRIAIHTLAEP